MKNPGPQLSQKFKVTLPAQAPLGIQDLRVVTKGGVSNPRAFVVSDTLEVVEQEPNDNVDKAQKVALNTAISGVIGTPIDGPLTMTFVVWLNPFCWTPPQHAVMPR